MLNGCGIAGVCAPGDVCEGDVSERRGFKCYPRIAANGEKCADECKESSAVVHWKEGWTGEWTGWNQKILGNLSDDRPYVRERHEFKEYHTSNTWKCTTVTGKSMHCGPREEVSAKNMSCQGPCEKRNREYFYCDVGGNNGFEVEKYNWPTANEKWTADQDYCLPKRTTSTSTSTPTFVLAANGERCTEECKKSSAVVHWREGWTGELAGWNREELWRYEEDRSYVRGASYFREYHSKPSYKCATESGKMMYCGVAGGVSATGILCNGDCKYQHRSQHGITTRREYYYCDVGPNNGFEVQEQVGLDLKSPKNWTAAEDFCSPMESTSVHKLSSLD